MGLIKFYFSEFDNSGKQKLFLKIILMFAKKKKTFFLCGLGFLLIRGGVWEETHFASSHEHDTFAVISGEGFGPISRRWCGGSSTCHTDGIYLGIALRRTERGISWLRLRCGPSGRLARGKKASRWDLKKLTDSDCELRLLFTFR